MAKKGAKFGILSKKIDPHLVDSADWTASADFQASLLEIAMRTSASCYGYSVKVGVAANGLYLPPPAPPELDGVVDATAGSVTLGRGGQPTGSSIRVRFTAGTLSGTVQRLHMSVVQQP